MTCRRASALFGFALAVLTAGCGQQGPLVLPEEARPIERLEQPPGTEPETQDDDERRDER